MSHYKMKSLSTLSLFLFLFSCTSIVGQVSDESNGAYSKIRTRKILLDLTVFAISGAGVAGSIAVAPLVALVTAGGLLATKLIDQLKYNKKLVILKKINKELRFIINEIEGYKRGNEYNASKFLERLNFVDGFISNTEMEV